MDKTNQKIDKFFESRKEYFLKDHFNERYYQFISFLLVIYKKYFRVTYIGLDKIPKGPAIYVANHNIGAVFEIFLFFLAFKSIGREKEIKGLAHQVSFKFPLKYIHIEKLGGIYAHPLVAKKNLENSNSLLCFPGGDLECFRLFKDRYKVNYFNRKGFAKLAKENLVPIVPVTIIGSHAMYHNIISISFLEKFLKKLRIKGPSLNLEFLLVLVVLLLNISLWAKVFLVYIILMPIPSKVKIDFGEEISKEEIQNLSIDKIYEKAINASQAKMDELSLQRRTPWG